MGAASAPTVITQLGSAGKRAIGDKFMEIQEMPVVSGNTSATVTASALSRIDYCIVIGVQQSSYPTYSGNTATLAFIDPVATVKCQLILIGV